jgi:inward rectifier potassium channel
MARPHRSEVVIRLGERPSPRDLYHRLLIMNWPAFLAVMASVYLAGNLLFAVLYLVGDDAIANARPGAFTDAFFFSVQTMATIGYGVMYPQTLYANILMTLESLLGMVTVAIGAGLVFARVSRPTARVLFSNRAVVLPYEGVPTLMIRAANQRRNQILQAEVQLTLARNETSAEGHRMRRFQELKLSRSRSPLFDLTWTMMHPIDAESPLRDATPSSMQEIEAEIIVTLSGVDESYAQTIHARTSFAAEDIHWNRRFADVLTELPNGRRAVDYRRFHDTVPL